MYLTMALLPWVDRVVCVLELKIMSLQMDALWTTPLLGQFEDKI